MIKVQVSTLIQRSATDVFDYISNFENNPSWQKDMIRATFTSEGPLRKGSTYDQVAVFLGKEIKTSFLTTEYIPHQKITIKSQASTFPIKVTRIVEDTPDGAKVSALIEGNPGSLFLIANPILNRIVQRSVNNDYKRLKHRLENDQRFPLA